MEPRRAVAELSLPLAAVVLAVFLAAGAGAGVLARGFVSSLGATPATVIATATASTVARHATPTTPPTVTPTQAGPAGSFLLQITATPSHVSAGAVIKVTVVATTDDSAHKPVTGLSCALAAPRAGPSGLLSAWPAAQATDASGATNWTITVPASQPAGTYGIEVSATGANHHSIWQDTFVYVS